MSKNREIMRRIIKEKIVIPKVNKVDIQNWRSSGPDLDKFLAKSLPPSIPILCINWRYQMMIYSSIIMNGLNKALPKVTKEIFLGYMSISSEDF